MKAIKKSFHYFKPRSINENIDTDTFEKVNKFRIPPLFKEFLKSFYFNNDGLIPEVFLLLKNKDTFGIGRLYFLPRIEDLYLGELFSLLMLRTKIV
jgi:hypothetical protein